MKKIISICIIIFAQNIYAQTNINERYKTSSVSYINNILTVSTGKVERTWKLTTSGLVTIGIKNSITGKQWANKSNKICDWNYTGIVSDNSTCKLIKLTAKKSNDDGFTSDYLDIMAEFEYPSNHTFIKYNIWAYPNAPGLRTQVWIKGSLSNEMLKKQTKINDSEISFKLNKGKRIRNYQASEYSQLWNSSWVADSKKIEYQAFGLKKDKKYQLGLSWWDYEGKGRIQKVTLTSIDGENSVEVLKPTTLPDYANKKEMPKEILLDVPSTISLDGSIRIIIESANNKPITIGELWIYEKTENFKNDKTLIGDENRLNELNNSVKHSYSLVAYTDCGNEPDKKVLNIYGRADFLPINMNDTKRIYAGYYNDTQHRNTKETPLLKEEIKNNNLDGIESVNWANLLMIEKDNEGLAVVKESHKCVNQYGVATGDFRISSFGVENRGTSLYPSDLSPDEYKWFWPSWTILWSGNFDEGRLAIKEFDRIRYPVIPDLDIYIMANTWGSSHNKIASKEANVLKEINSQSNLGIDVQQIDDGWMDKNWHPSKEWYPNGWENVVSEAKSKNIKLGLWGAAMKITPEALRYNFEKGGFVVYKLDFANLSTHNNIDKTIKKIRDFILFTNHKVRVNWDVTENAPRYGYFWAREYGAVFLENRKPDVPKNVVYVPYLVLRDLWHLAKYANLNKFQGTVQNKDMIDKKLSDAYKYDQDYCTVIPLMSSPLFFQETQYLSKKSIREIKPILAKYKNVRKQLYNSYIFPIGNEPNNASWTGFQAYNPKSKSGYLTLFREINNKVSSKKIQLKFIKNQIITFSNLMTNKSFTIKSDQNGFILFKINKNADYRFYKYSIK